MSRLSVNFLIYFTMVVGTILILLAKSKKSLGRMQYAPTNPHEYLIYRISMQRKICPCQLFLRGELIIMMIGRDLL